MTAFNIVAPVALQSTSRSKNTVPSHTRNAPLRLDLSERFCASAAYASANRAQAALAIRLPTALAAINSGGCSSARMIMAAPPAVGNAAINDPTNGPLRSTTTDAATTIEAVIAIFNASPYQNNGFPTRALISRPAFAAPHRSSGWRQPKPAMPTPAQA